ncbi:Tetratricopeptide repeat protein 33-like protein [Drosera capensis]
MKLTWKTPTAVAGVKRRAIHRIPNLPFDNPGIEPESAAPSTRNPDDVDSKRRVIAADDKTLDDTSTHSGDVGDGGDASVLAESFLEQGNKLAEDGRYSEALGKWEAAINLMPQKAVLHEQKAQVLLETGDAWGATELEPSWFEAWLTLGRAQLNFGEPDNAVESFDTALSLKPESIEARDDRQTALRLVKRRNQLHTTGLETNTSRYVVGDKLNND